MSSAFGIVAPFGGGWILDHLAQTVEQYSPLELRRIVHGKGRTEEAVGAVLNAPPGEVGVVFAHHIPFHEVLVRTPSRAAQDVLFFGHYFDHPIYGDKPAMRELVSSLGRAARIWTNASIWDRWLIERGIDAARISRIVQVVDADRFTLRSKSDWRDRFTVGLVSQYHFRKNERFIIDAVERWPHVDWVLLGRGWNNTPMRLLQRLSGSPNFRFIDTASVSFDQWPDIFRGFDAFLSPSFCEGGPIPLLETMASGVWPIASRTGFAEDVIAQGLTGHVFEIDSDLDFDQCLNRALVLARPEAERVRAAVTGLSWERFGRAAVGDLLGLWSSGQKFGAL